MLEALKLDRTPMQGRPVFVSKCEDRSQKKAQFKVRESVFILFAGLGQRGFFLLAWVYSIVKIIIEH